MVRLDGFCLCFAEALDISARDICAGLAVGLGDLTSKKERLTDRLRACQRPNCMIVPKRNTQDLLKKVSASVELGGLAFTDYPLRRIDLKGML